MLGLTITITQININYMVTDLQKIHKQLDMSLASTAVKGFLFDIPIVFLRFLATWGENQMFSNENETTVLIITIPKLDVTLTVNRCEWWTHRLIEAVALGILSKMCAGNKQRLFYYLAAITLLLFLGAGAVGGLGCGKLGSKLSSSASQSSAMSVLVQWPSLDDCS